MFWFLFTILSSAQHLGDARKAFLEQLALGQACDEEELSELWLKQQVDEKLVEEILFRQHRCTSAGVVSDLVGRHGELLAVVIRRKLAQDFDLIADLKQDLESSKGTEISRVEKKKHIKTAFWIGYDVGVAEGLIYKSCKLARSFAGQAAFKFELQGQAVTGDMKGVKKVCAIKVVVAEVNRDMREAGIGDGSESDEYKAVTASDPNIEPTTRAPAAESSDKTSE